MTPRRPDCRRAFTLIELLVVISIIAVLAGLAVSATSLVMRQARTTHCMNNLRQIGLASLAYVGDCEGILPYTTTGGFYWTYTINLADFITMTPALACCKESLRQHPGTYSHTFGHNRQMNGSLNAEARLSERFYLADSYYDVPGGWFGFNINEGTVATWAAHGRRNNLWFLDGHAGSLALGDRF